MTTSADTKFSLETILRTWVNDPKGGFFFYDGNALAWQSRRAARHADQFEG